MPASPLPSLNPSAEAVRKASVDIREELEELKESIAVHNAASGGSKIGAGVAGVIGGACVVAAPFTGGTSLAIAGGVLGGAATITGVGVLIGKAVKDPQFQAKMMELRSDFEKATRDFEIEASKRFESQSKKKGGGKPSTDSVGLTKESVKMSSAVTSTVGGVAKASVSSVVEKTTVITVTESGQQVAAQSVTQTTTKGAATVAKSCATAAGVFSMALGVVDIVQGIKVLLAADTPTEEAIEKIIDDTFEVEAWVDDVLRQLDPAALEISLKKRGRPKERTSRANPLEMNVRPGTKQEFSHEVIEAVEHESGGLFFKQRVYITVKRGGIKLAIRDGEGDTYSLNCIKAGRHYVDYNSSDPRIVSVAW